MFIKAIKISDYKSFNQTDWIEVDPDLTLVVGPNNSGKTAFLEALSGKMPSKPHIHRDGSHGSGSSVIYRISFTRDYLVEMLANGPVVFSFWRGLEVSEFCNKLYHFLDRGEFDILVRCEFTAKPKITPIAYSIAGTQHSTGGGEFDVRLNDANEPISLGKVNDSIRFIDRVAEDFIIRSFIFSSERMRLHTSRRENATELRSDASNLAVLLSRQVQENNYRFREEYCKLLRQVIPSATDISLDGISDTDIKIKIWPESQANGGNTSYFLEDCGTGIGQVLAMVYLLVYEAPSIVIIDEPNSFLHPAATRELIGLFRSSQRHQFFISTHSSEVFNVARPKKYIELSYSGFETSAATRLGTDIASTYQILGISPFFEITVWVEGPTEVEAFGHIYDHSAVRYVNFSVSDLISRKTSRREIARLLEIYRNFLNADRGEPVNTKMILIVDGEHLNMSDQTEYRNSGIVHFLQRRMFENYLLHPKAIHHVISRDISDAPTPEQIAEFLNSNRGNTEESEWLQNVHGANLLHDCFSTLTETRCQFDKTNHSVAITHWISEKDPNFLDGLRNEIKEAILHEDTGSPA